MKAKLQISKLNTGEAIYSLAFALMAVLSRHAIYSDEVESSILTVRMTSLEIIDVPIFALVAVVVYLLLQIMKLAIDKFGSYVYDNGEGSRNNKYVSWFIIFAVIMICYIPYMMSYWPGGIYNDTSDSIDIALGKSPMSNQNTVLYALFWRLIFAIGQVFDQGDYGGLKLMTVLQCVAIAGVAAGFITWLRRRGVCGWVCVMLTVAVALFPIFPYYGVSLWKETWFGLALFFYVWMWYASQGELKGIKEVTLYILSTTWVIFSRNNGLYLVLFTVVIAGIVLVKKLGWRAMKRFTVVNITVVVVSLLFQGPIYSAAGIRSSSPAESLGIPIQQVAYMIGSSAVDNTMADVVIEDTEQAVRERLSMTESEYEVISSIMPLESWIIKYNPIVVDALKFSDDFDKKYFEAHTGEFLKTYLSLVFKNPGYAIKGYLISTMGFWDAFKSSSSAYICTQHTPQAEYFMSDYFTSKTGRVLSDIVGPRWYISGGALIWIMLGLCVISLSLRRSGSGIVRHEGEKSGSSDLQVLVFLPGIALWLTYMLATPLSFSFRYLFGILLCMPLFFCQVFIPCANDSGNS